MKVDILTPTGRNDLTVPYVNSILSLRVPPGVELGCRMVQSTYIDNARNQLVKIALDDCADYILWVDSDMAFKPSSLERLLAHDKDIITGVATKRLPPYFPCVYERDPVGGPGHYINHDPWREARKKGEDGPDFSTKKPAECLQKIDACGSAFLLIKTKVYRDISPPWYAGRVFLKVTGESSIYSEDLTFCEKVREAGYDMWADWGVDVGHLGEQMFSVLHYRAFMEANPGIETEWEKNRSNERELKVIENKSGKKKR